jgi:hypothetical protein
MSRTKKSKTQTDPEVCSSYPLVSFSMTLPIVSTSSLMAGARFCPMNSCISQGTVGIVKNPSSCISSRIQRAVLYKAEYTSFVSISRKLIPYSSYAFLRQSQDSCICLCRDNFSQLHFTSLPHRLMQRDLPPDSEFAILAHSQ